MVLKDSPCRLAIDANNGDVSFLKNRTRVLGDVPAYKANQLLGAQVVGAFALKVRFCRSSSLAASFSQSESRVQTSWRCFRAAVRDACMDAYLYLIICKAASNCGAKRPANLAPFVPSNGLQSKHLETS
eukprot:5807593-Pleurochrysis_carterae.AAC.2